MWVTPLHLPRCFLPVPPCSTISSGPGFQWLQHSQTIPTANDIKRVSSMILNHLDLQHFRKAMSQMSYAPNCQIMVEFQTFTLALETKKR